MIYPGSLHNHSEYSNIRLRDSISKLDDLVWTAANLGHSVVAVTDHDCLSSHLKAEKVYKKVKEKYPHFKMIRGNEIYLCRNDLTAENFVRGEDDYFHFVLLAKDAIGHEQLREISTRAWHRSYIARNMRRVPTYYDDLIEIIYSNPGHLIGSTACLGGYIPKQILRYHVLKDKSILMKIQTWLLDMNRLFGEGNFYLELQPSYNKEQQIVNTTLVQLSKQLNIPYIITNDAHYLLKEDREIHKAYLNSQNGDREVDAFYETTYLMTTEQLLPYFEDILSPEEVQYAFENIQKIRDMCEDYSLEKSLRIPELSWKTPGYISTETKDKYFELMPELLNFYTSDYNGDKVLAELVIEKICSDERLQAKDFYEAIEENLTSVRKSSEVNKVHWSAYFLNLQHILDTCWSAGTIVGPGRGSGVGFALLYAMDIIQINPLWEKARTFSWRFLNPDRVSVLDIDVDVESGRRPRILEKLRETYGRDRVANVITFGTEGSKSAIQTGARGLDLDVDIALYISSLVPSDRGKPRTLAQCYYGDKEKGFAPIPAFVQQMDQYPELWSVAQRIEGLVCRSGTHAGGIIFVDEPFTKSVSLMRAPDGTLVTAYDLHDSEACGLIKMDLLSVNCLDKIHNCIDLICDYGYAERKPTLKETYESIVGIYNIERDEPEMWKMVHRHEIYSLFQMEQQSGVQGIALIKPTSVEELATLNSVIRLMAQEKGGEQPLNKWARHRARPQDWIDEMVNYGLSQEEINWLVNYPLISDGLAESQEALMALVQEPRLGGNSLTFADKCRKGIGKKIDSLVAECEKEFFQNVKEKNCSERLAHYVWDVLLKVQLGYSFNLSHTLAYSLVALQEMNLAYKYPAIFWNCACAISDSGGEEDSANYNKIANVIGRMIQSGIKVNPPDINLSSYTFVPNPKDNSILFGLKGLINVGIDVINQVIENRPYTSIKDFYVRVKPKRQAMITLIKAGAFDNLIDRKLAMAWFLWEVCDKKKRLTLQNMPSLMKYNLLPNISPKMVLAKRVYEFNRYLKAVCKVDNEYYRLDTRAYDFLIEIEQDDLIESGGMLSAKLWDKKVYQKHMDVIREYIRENLDELLQQLNDIMFMNEWEKDATGTISTWEMAAMCFYYHEHELANLNMSKYGFRNFSDLPEEPEVDYVFKKGGRDIPIYKLDRICGTVIAKDKNKSLVTLLTTEGVVTVKFRKEFFSLYDKQISVKDDSGVKHVVERSWMNKGRKLAITGHRNGDMFVAKKYAKTPYHTLYLITNVYDNGDIDLKSERATGFEEEADE